MGINLPDMLEGLLGAVLESFEEMGFGDVLVAGQVGDGAGEFDYPMISPGREVQPAGRIVEESGGGFGQRSESF